VGRRSLAWDPGRPANAGGWAAARNAPGCGQGEVEAAGWIGDRDAEQLQTASVHPRRTACPLSAIRQHTSLATPCAAGRRLDPSARMSWDDAVQSMVLESGVWGAALASHGRSHRFDPCHTHQPRRFPASVARAACQKTGHARHHGGTKVVPNGPEFDRSRSLGCRRSRGRGARPAWCQLSRAVPGREARRSKRSVGGQGRLGRAGRRGLAGSRRGGPG
jgi:hypothetical protein